jgi:hypothetical protein
MSVTSLGNHGSPGSPTLRMIVDRGLINNMIDAGLASLRKLEILT